MELLSIELQECPVSELPELLEAIEVQQNGEPDWQMLSWLCDRHDYQHVGTWKMVRRRGRIRGGECKYHGAHGGGLSWGRRRSACGLFGCGG
jgi:hypothetical protein